MANKIKPSENNNIFKVKGDGTIERIGNADLQSNNSGLEKELLDLFEVNSYSKTLLAACKARKIANKISKKKYGKQNYKEYVEMLMVKHFPKELEKAQLGGKYLFWLLFSIILFVLSIFFEIPAIAVCRHDSGMAIFAVLLGLVAVSSLLLMWKVVIPTYKKLKELYQ